MARGSGYSSFLSQQSHKTKEKVSGEETVAYRVQHWIPSDDINAQYALAYGSPRGPYSEVWSPIKVINHVGKG